MCRPFTKRYKLSPRNGPMPLYTFVFVIMPTSKTGLHAAAPATSPRTPHFASHLFSNHVSRIRKLNPCSPPNSTHVPSNHLLNRFFWWGVIVVDGHVRRPSERLIR